MYYTFCQKYGSPRKDQSKCFSTFFFYRFNKPYLRSTTKHDKISDHKLQNPSDNKNSKIISPTCKRPTPFCVLIIDFYPYVAVSFLIWNAIIVLLYYELCMRSLIHLSVLIKLCGSISNLTLIDVHLTYSYCCKM